MNAVKLGRAFAYLIFIIIITQIAYIALYGVITETLYPLVVEASAGLDHDWASIGENIIMFLNYAPYMWIGGYMIVYLVLLTILDEGDTYEY